MDVLGKYTNPAAVILFFPNSHMYFTYKESF